MSASNGRGEIAGLDRVPPHSLEAEQSVLGAMMLDREATATGCEILTRGDFYREVHARVFDAIRVLFERAEPVDLVTLAAELQTRGDFESVGGGEYLMALASAVPTARNAKQYAEIVRDQSHLRKLLTATQTIASWAYGGQKEARQILDDAEAELFGVTQLRISTELMPIGEFLFDVQHGMEVRQSQRGVVGLPTGLTELDKLVTGLQRGELFILAARPSMGKTSLAMNMATHIATSVRLPSLDNPDDHTRKPVVAIFSLEMSKESLVESMLCSEAGVNSDRVRKGTLPRDAWGPIGEAAARLFDSAIWIDDTPGMTSLEIRAKARRVKARHGLDAVFVDYLQRMTPHGRFDSEHLAVGAMAREMKTLARELDVPVVLLSQLSRRVEQRSTKAEDMRPMLSDLLASGLIEAEADVVAFLYRPAYYRTFMKQRDADMEDEAPEPPKDVEGSSEEAEIIIGKNRNGPTGTATVAFQKHYRRFINYAPGDYDDVR